MRNLRRAAVGLVAAIALVPVLALTPASAATCTLTPASVTLSEQPTKVTFGVRSDPGYPLWSAEIPDVGLSASQDSRTRTLDAEYLHNLSAGTHSAKVHLESTDYESWSSCATSFRIRRAAALSLKARKVPGGRQFSGRLTRIDFGWHFDRHDNPQGAGSPTWSPLGGRTVKIQYRAQRGWVTAATVKTVSNGTFTVTRNVGKHQWRAVYAGSGTTGARISKGVTR